VGHAARDSSVAESVGTFRFRPRCGVTDFRIPHGQEGADLGLFFADKVERKSAPVFRWETRSPAEKFGLRRSNALQQERPELDSQKKIARAAWPTNSRRGRPRNFSTKRSPSTTRESGEEHQTVLQIAHDLINIVFQGGKDFLASRIWRPR